MKKIDSISKGCWIFNEAEIINHNLWFVDIFSFDVYMEMTSDFTPWSLLGDFMKEHF